MGAGAQLYGRLLDADLLLRGELRVENTDARVTDLGLIGPVCGFSIGILKGESNVCT